MDKTKTQVKLAGSPSRHAWPTSTKGSGPGDLPGPRIKLEGQEGPEFPAGGQAPSRVLPYVPVDKHFTSPRKTWEARRRQRGREARPVVVSAPVHPKADAPT